MNSVTLKLQAEPLILSALREDITSEDVTTASVIGEKATGEVRLIAKEDGVICGLDVFARTFELLDPTATCEFSVEEGADVTAGQDLGCVRAHVRALLSGERVALNYLQRMSGIATYTRRMVRALEGSGVTLVDTRKTTPTLRVFEKAATRAGGARNHRFNLSDAVMLKDNHIAAAGGIAPAVRAVRARAPFTSRIEVECETLDQVREAMAAHVDIVMLDNMGEADLHRAVAAIAGRAAVEVSGNVTLANVARYARLPIDYLSSGALTHSAGILDLSMKHLVIEE